MAKRKATKRRKRRNARIPDRAFDHATIPHAAGLRHAIPLPIPTYWTPEQAIAVFELVDDLREQIWSFYQTDVQEMNPPAAQAGVPRSSQNRRRRSPILKIPECSITKGPETAPYS
jgi:hypothetical protein